MNPTPGAINRAIAEILGVKPELVEWMAYKDGASCMSAARKEDVEKWLAELPEGSWAKSYEPKAFYRYPNYCGDLNLIQQAVRGRIFSERRLFIIELQRVMSAGMPLPLVSPEYLIFANPQQWAEAFLKVHGKWNHGNLEEVGT